MNETAVVQENLSRGYPADPVFFQGQGLFLSNFGHLTLIRSCYK